MLQTIISILLQVLCVFGMLTLITFLIATIFAIISGIKEIYEQNKIKSKELKTLQKNFNTLIQTLDKQKKDS